MGAKGKRLLLLDLLIAAAGLLADQYTKYLAVLHLKGQPAIVLIPGVLELRYLENRGAAFGVLQNQKPFFVVSTILVLAVCAFVLYHMPQDGKYRLLHVLGACLAAGAAGNFLDRLRLDYVVDFIYISLIDFPIFNVADMFVSFVCVLGVILMIWGPYREEDLAFLKDAVRPLMFWKKDA